MDEPRNFYNNYKIDLDLNNELCKITDRVQMNGEFSGTIKNIFKDDLDINTNNNKIKIKVNFEVKEIDFIKKHTLNYNLNKIEEEILDYELENDRDSMLLDDLDDFSDQIRVQI